MTAWINHQTRNIFVRDLEKIINIQQMLPQAPSIWKDFFVCLFKLLYVGHDSNQKLLSDSGPH